MSPSSPIGLIRAYSAAAWFSGCNDLYGGLPRQYGGELFSHTSAVFVDVAGKRIFDQQEAQRLLADLNRNRQFITERGKFADQNERQRVLKIYDEAIEILKDKR